MLKKTTAPFLVIAVLLLAPAGVALAASDTANLAITGTVASSVSVSLATGTGGATVSGTKPNYALSTLGTFGRGSTIPNWTKDVSSANSYTFSTPVNVSIDAANTTSTAATITAYMESAPATGVSFKFAGTTVASSAIGAQTSISGTFSLDSTTQNYSADNTVAVTVADNFAAAAIDNTIHITVTVN